MLNGNNRPLIIAINSQPATPIELPLEFPNNEIWRSMIYVESTECKIRCNDGNTSGRTALLVGGIQADDDVNVVGGMTMHIQPETPTDLLETLSPRYGWIETYLAP